MGGVMGWTPAEIRRSTIADMLACFDGYLMSQGVNDEPKHPTREDRIVIAEYHRKIHAKRAKEGRT